MDMLERVTTVAEVVKLFYIDHMKVRRAVNEGKIRSRRSGGTLLLAWDDVVMLFGQPIIDME